MPENLEEFIQFTATGNFKRKAINAYAEFLGYKEFDKDNIPNPISKLEFVENYIKQVLVDEMSKMNIAEAKKEAQLTYKQTLIQIENTVKTEVETGVTINSQIII